MELIEVLDTLRIEHRGSGHRHGRNGWVQVDCPKCGRNTGKFHCGISLQNGAANCWQCGPQRLFGLLLDASGRPAAEVSQALRGYKRPAYRPQGRQDDTPRQCTLPGGRVDLLDSISHVEYLAGRGFDPAELVTLWQLEAIQLSGSGLSWRVFIPIVSGGRVVSWTTRTIGDHLQRYLSASATQESVPHRHLLYGEDYARHAVVIVEGPADVWAIGPGAVATCGLSYTPQQVARMARYPVRVVCFDSSRAAQARAGALANDLAVFPGETHVLQLDAEDAGAAEEDEIQALRAFAFGD
jgi:hypothetical protein